MPIALFRVDERLIHGQVVVGWGERIHMDRILVVDDQLRASDWEQELYCLGVPRTVASEFVSVEEARREFPAWREDPRNLVVLVRDVGTLARLAEGGLLSGIEINLGGLHAAPGRTRVLPYLFLGPEERDQLREVASTGARIAARDLPASRPVALETILDGA
jgi:PTS system mannose-specific IIB component/fructoselysine and glucoselysine-specific PTS system IIB component